MFWNWEAQPWLGNDVPHHPHYDDLKRVGRATKSVKFLFYSLLLRELTFMLKTETLPRSIQSHPHADLPNWMIALLAHRYGVIYLLSRAEARVVAPFVERHGKLLDAMGEHLQESKLATRVYNAAFEAYVHHPVHRLERGCEVVPPNCVVSIDGGVLVREEDFQGCFGRYTDQALYDLHDLAHAAATRVCPELYASRFGDMLPELSDYAKDLVRSPGFRRADGVLCADRIVFSELLMWLFDREEARMGDPKTLVELMAQEIAEYLLGRKALYHPGAQRYVEAESPVSVEELAVLAQIKAYELSASEIEQHVFVRGGSSSRDEFHALSTTERVLAIAASTGLTYNERRNVYKHRAQTRAYVKIADDIAFRVTADGDLLLATASHLAYRDYWLGKRQNLFKLVLATGQSLARTA